MKYLELITNKFSLKSQTLQTPEQKGPDVWENIKGKQGLFWSPLIHKWIEKTFQLTSRTKLSGSNINFDLTKEQIKEQHKLREIQKQLTKLPDFENKKVAIYKNKLHVDHQPISADALKAAGINQQQLTKKVPTELYKFNVSTFHFNARSLCNKLHNFQGYIYASLFDVICVTKTWLNCEIVDN